MSRRAKIIIIAATIAILAATGVFSYYAFLHFKNEALIKQQVLEARKASWDKLKEYIKNSTKGYKGETAIVIKDLETGWQIDFNKDEDIPSASLVKIPIMMAYFCAAQEGKLKLSDTIELKAADRVDGSGPVKLGLPGSSYTIEDLIYSMITQSDNTAANMLINRFGIDELNRYFAKFGLKHTNLSRKMMDFKLRKHGIENYTTVADMAYILEELYDGKFINKKISEMCLKLLAGQKVNDRIPKRLPPGVIVAHKTGLENGVCHDVGIVYTKKGSFLICVMTKHNYTTARSTKRLISRISLLAYNYYNEL
jgi:beta-lactamase class A